MRINLIYNLSLDHTGLFVNNSTQICDLYEIKLCLDIAVHNLVSYNLVCMLQIKVLAYSAVYYSKFYKRHFCLFDFCANLSQVIHPKFQVLNNVGHM